MKPSKALIAHCDTIRRVVAQNRTCNPRVFGSILRGDDTDQSDLDLLVDPFPETTLLDMGNIQAELEDLLGIKVDVLTPRDLPARYREQVVREAEPI